MKTLESQHLRCGYGSHVVLSELSLVAEPGQVLALLGPNGAGKTTLLKALARLLRPERGHVVYRGQDVWRESARQAARWMAVMPQNESRDWPLTVQESVLLGRSPHRGWLVPFMAEDYELADAAMTRLQLGPLRERPITQLSGGEWRRVVLARALAQQPEVLLLDEPTAQLDLKYQLETLQHIRHLAHDDGLVVILTLHDLNQAALYADRVALLGGEGLVAVGTAREVFTAETLAGVYGIPVKVVSHPVYDAPFVVPLHP
jgi:iron complex transport system ATP-binding protein